MFFNIYQYSSFGYLWFFSEPLIDIIFFASIEKALSGTLQKLGNKTLQSQLKLK